MSLFQQNPNGTNELAQGDGFYVSFNPAPCASLPGWGADDDSGETALVFNGSFLILRGDHRAKYEPLIAQGIAACVDYFRQRPSLHSSWCSGPEYASIAARPGEAA